MNQNYIIRIIFMACIYFIAAKLSFLISVENTIVTLVIFSAEGFALAGILLFGKKLWPGIFIGQFLVSYSVGMDISPSLLTASINSIEAILAFYLFARFKLNKSLPRLKDILGLTALIFLVLQPFSSILGNSVLFGFNIIESDDFIKNTFAWWFGNGMGQLLITPFLLYFSSKYKDTNMYEFVANALFFLALSYIFIIHLDIKYLALLLTATMPFVIYISYKRDLHFATFGVIIITFVSIYSTHLNVGIFSGDDLASNIISLNFYILSQMMLALIIGVLFAENKVVLNKLNQMALYDNLTGLPNRHLLEDKIEHAINNTKRNKNKTTICFIDVDYFKNVNDTLGHYAGDEVLKIISSRILNIITKKDSLLRIGGDEFVLILTTDSIDNTTALLNKISDEINQPIKLNNGIANVSLSIGISMYPSDGKSSSELIASADQAMYTAKNKGKNRFEFYNLVA